MPLSYFFYKREWEEKDFYKPWGGVHPVDLFWSSSPQNVVSLDLLPSSDLSHFGQYFPIET